MPFSSARNVWSSLRPARAGYCGALAALLLVIGSNSLQNATAEGDTRTLSFKHSHTGEQLSVTFKVNGRYDDAALKRINHLLRDWREDHEITIDPHLMDVIWEVYREVEATEPIVIVCGYRSPATNAMLRRRSSGVAKFSQHMLGKAMDFYIPGVQLEKLREAGLRAQRGGVGFYPSSNFVHLDTGTVRHWPRMPEAQLARVLAKGPLTRFAGKDTTAPVQTAAATGFKLPGPLAKLFGQEDEVQQVAQPDAVAETKSQKTAPKVQKTVERPFSVAATPTPPARPANAQAGTVIQPATFQVASAESRPVQLRSAQSASLVARGGDAPTAAPSANEVIGTRGLWQSQPDAPQAPAQRGTTVASADPAATGSVSPWPMPERDAKGAALAYAPATQSTPAQPRQAATVAKRGTQQTAGAVPVATGQAVPAKVGQRFDDPWTRAIILAPSAERFMSMSPVGDIDYRQLASFLRKPASTIMMTFSNDPHLGMNARKFGGTAVVFVATVTFDPQRTAALSR